MELAAALTLIQSTAPIGYEKQLEVDCGGCGTK
jgi:hypothetical protein